MVGVPHSGGCRTCIQRRVKCDQTRPECRRCQSRAIQCPGYRKILRFYHSTPASDDFVDAISLARTRHTGDRDAQTSKLAVLTRPTMDESVAPSLVMESLDLQLKEVFGNMITATFPVTFATFTQRVDPDWKVFVRHHATSQPLAITLCVRCLNTWYLAVQHQDKDKTTASRHMYNRALCSLNGLLRNPSMVKSDTTLACAILLAVYEMWDGVGPNSWLVHSRGVKALFRLRGPGAHLHGFGRTLFTTYRSFLVADALCHQEPCFLAETEWRQMVMESLATEERDGERSELVEVTENLFNEITFCPGFLKETRSVIAQVAPGSLRDSLVTRIWRSRAILQHLRQRLVILQKGDVQFRGRSRVVSSISTDFVQPITRFSLEGADSALALLGQMLVILETHKNQLLHSESTVGLPMNPWRKHITPSPILLAGERHIERKLSDRLDRIAMTMGVCIVDP
ncbi:hypothetical protein BDV59DRAFT_70638 [Aspergillus ambiguus]|uniref:Zn(II)2Cys6 transcription factor n=1 Tax=Aspergillus ambiguus TaxID=176160 RepID=UPI003CCD645C